MTDTAKVHALADELVADDIEAAALLYALHEDDELTVAPEDKSAIKRLEELDLAANGKLTPFGTRVAILVGVKLKD